MCDTTNLPPKYFILSSILSKIPLILSNLLDEYHMIINFKIMCYFEMN
ncbi:hypothetical protein AO372_0028 [Moraxella catarrhalis]|nr:hypothetical protein AO376_1918 [Moraxella catarrhalis]OAV20215.1 hypothetical protein AO374_0485 [Moraxella catarrhalis]OAV23000.1 hypothetical protein AO372_0028 [Moraxella catarrhalis]OAV28742.1 hypothetical protein AO369_0494 [Moraxella catarrhalis]